ncbi:uncharacterized protein MYCFIDRAFT_197923 [Pseudocercospora fijiensis CIRAD86]|uniref:Isopentenyl-diphosphate delta-isomerase n=1 Tax=Pseudocercospora fijiensis (strain CIRAD86) TaxID=383855 RepID=M3AUE8_PSEFD|nr:uncharacterized protein MYCFIDRAFT_197923 [Pseudocercospora fijiensis CIRAD86]EME81112.1 hypothetical protein MYCFIDRAFT_197923 [Pseudocercospora fijiensis CIRAD86]
MSGRGARAARGAYYKARYGGRGRGAAGDSHAFNETAYRSSQDQANATSGHLKSWQQLERDLVAIDSQQYGAYKRLLGTYQHEDRPHFTLVIDHIQGDAYAAPSRVRAIVKWSHTGFPDDCLRHDIRRIALCDYVTRVAASIISSNHLHRKVGSANGGWGGPKGGAFSINQPGQEILPRTSAMISGNDSIELRFTVSLPAAGRTILGQQAWQILGVNLVDVVGRSLFLASLDERTLERHISSAEQQHSLRQQLDQRGLVAFVANGSVLPRASGASQTPMNSPDVVKFQSPKELEVTLTSAHLNAYTGMGIPKGVTVLTGGGFHGKSTLLEALELGIYNHVPGDGREAAVSDETAVKIRAEDGRCVSKTDISPYISQLPGAKPTNAFTTEDASGSTSMATNIQEALEVGCKTILIDEDSSATNLLVRDWRMEALIRNEPITPLISKARALWQQHGVSTVIVIGGLGDWLSIADNVIAMDSYRPHCINQEVQDLMAQHSLMVTQDEHYGSIPKRALRIDLEGLRSPFASRKKFISMSSQQRDAVDDPSRAESGIDLGGLDQIVEIGQSRTIATLLPHIAAATKEHALSLADICERLNRYIGTETGLPTSLVGGELVAIRRFELAAAISRLRGVTLRVDSQP